MLSYFYKTVLLAKTHFVITVVACRYLGLAFAIVDVKIEWKKIVLLIFEFSVGEPAGNPRV